MPNEVQMIERVELRIKTRLSTLGYTFLANNSSKELAKCAIEAMREPTEGMIEVFNETVDNGGGLDRKAYRAMIDAALKEE